MGSAHPWLTVFPAGTDKSKVTLAQGGSNDREAVIFHRRTGKEKYLN